MALIDTPFVLLDDARPVGAAPARLYRAPSRIIAARSPKAVRAALGALASAAGHLAGFIGYEAGHTLEPRLAPLISDDPQLPLVWFGQFEGYEEIDPAALAGHLPNPAGGWAGRPRPQVEFATYAAALEQVHGYIAAGDIYQANLTFSALVSIAGDPLAVYAGLRDRAKAGYGGIVWTGEDWLLSLSPELFFALHDGKITTKPMKGTAARGADPDADAAAIALLKSDPKQRAENLMIVDLLRNDLSRVAVPGSVDVPHLFTVETYPTVHTMTSTVTAQIKAPTTAVDILCEIFPCGSITGAPKIRAMEIIEEIEAFPRGIYTGSIGRIDPNGDAAFNVAIRTLHLPQGAKVATLGLGSGIVADSKLTEEWQECHAKGAFVKDKRSFDLIETMRFEPDVGICLLERHLARMKASAAALDFTFDRHIARNELQAATFRLTNACRIRLMLAPTGVFAIEVTPLHPVPTSPVNVAIVPLPVSTSDFRLHHKTTNRDFYAAARAAAGTFEVLFIDPDGFITEGSFTNAFVQHGDQLLTPPLSRGLLPGILREELLQTGRAIEGDVALADLTNKQLLLGNASRGLFQAQINLSARKS